MFTGDILNDADKEALVIIDVAQQPEIKAVDGVDYLVHKVSVDIVARVQIEEVQLALYVSPPLVAVPEVAYYTSLNEKITFDSFVYSEGISDVCSLIVNAVVTYTTSLGIPRAVTCSKRLPISFIMETCPAQKENEFKFVLSINQSPVPLTSLFPGKITAQIDTHYERVKDEMVRRYHY